MTAPTFVVHGTPLSGHTHRVLDFLAILGFRPMQRSPIPEVED